MATVCNKTWVDKRGRNLTAAEVCAILKMCAGAAYTPEQLHEAYRVGDVYQNGYLWMQRLA